MKGFILLKRADQQSLWLRARDIIGVSEHPLQGSMVYVPGQTDGFLVQNSPKDIFERIEQAGAE